MLENTILLILPPILAITYSIVFRRATEGLSLGILSACLIIADFNIMKSLSIVYAETLNIFTASGSLYVIGFTILIGIMLELIHRTQADKHFIHFISQKLGVNSPLKARLVPLIIGSLIFTDTNLSIVSSGIVSRSLFDKFKIPRQVLAFIVDATCAPVSVLILLNGWGAFISQLLETNGIANSMQVTFSSIFYNFYPITILILVIFTVLSGKYFGPLAKAAVEDHTDFLNNDIRYDQSRIPIVVVPLVTVVILCILFLAITGGGDITRGSGALSVFSAVLLSLVIQLSYCIKCGAFKESSGYVDVLITGAWSMREMATIMFLAFLFGAVIKELGTGAYLSGLTARHLDMQFIPSAIFVLSAFVGFTTGTSWGTYGLMIPIASALSLSTGLDISLLTGAVLGGGVFGDHASPLSDTSILSSMISGVRLHEHVYTQLPYALLAAFISASMYILVKV